ncbi:MAG: indole-3-glycerol phosphate synthase TrpC [Bacteroidota bacterium]
MNYLDKIIKAKRKEIDSIKKKVPVSFLEKTSLYKELRPSFYNAVNCSGPSIIAEFKRRSPSKGILNEGADLISVLKAYEKSGACAVSVLTDKHFDGRAVDLSVAYETLDIAILRKDFIVDEFQIFEARSLGASAILLIAAVLEKNEIERFTGLSEELGLDVLLELHEKNEISKISSKNRIIGINNRNLRTFEVEIEQSKELLAELPEDILKVSESGIYTVETIMDLYEKGFDAFLMGKSL